MKVLARQVNGTSWKRNTIHNGELLLFFYFRFAYYFPFILLSCTSTYGIIYITIWIFLPCCTWPAGRLTRAAIVTAAVTR